MSPAAPVTEGGLLGGKLRYRQFSGGHRSGFEPVLLAASVPAKPGQRVLEAGSGAGAGLLCLAWRVRGVCGVAAEIDPALASLANENFNINSLEDVVSTQLDVEQARLAPEFDHAMANPPWHDSAGTKSPDPGRALAHHARPELLERWIAGLTRCLKPRGTLTLILPAAQYGAAAAGLRGRGYGALQLFPLWPRAGLAAKLVIIGAKRGAGGPDRVLPGLTLHDDSGISPDAQAILRDGMPTALAAS